VTRASVVIAVAEREALIRHPLIDGKDSVLSSIRCGYWSGDLMRDVACEVGQESMVQAIRDSSVVGCFRVAPISQSEVGSIEAFSLLRLSKLNCSITNSDGMVLLSSNV
jgi:hypothetical protein